MQASSRTSVFAGTAIQALRSALLGGCEQVKIGFAKLMGWISATDSDTKTQRKAFYNSVQAAIDAEPQ